MSPKEFLDSVFGELPAGSSIVIWALPDKSSRWCDSVDTAVKAVDSVKDRGDAYVGVSLQSLPAAISEARKREEGKAKRESRTARKIIGRMTRGFAETAVALTGVFIDIDVAGPGHKQSNLPADEDAALAIVDRSPIKPTIVVSSGGGIHVWYLFKECFVFENEADRIRAYTLSIAWQRTFQKYASAAGTVIDSTFDLTRVLRVPGTLNRKYDPPRECKVIAHNPDSRYDPSDLESVIDPADLQEAARRAGAAPAKAQSAPAEIPAGAVAPSGAVSHLVYNEKANVPIEMFEAISMNDPKFTKTWNRERKDLKDTSPSGWDMALTHIAVKAGWEDQSIVNLLIAHRRKHKDDLKLHRPDYYERLTIAAARKFHNQASAVHDLHSMLATDNPDSGSPINKKHSLDTVSSAIGTRIKAVFRYRQDPPRFRLVTNHGEIELGTVDNLIGQGAFRAAIAAADRKLIPTFKANDWNVIAQHLLNACEDVDTGAESTDTGLARAWVGRYLADTPPGDISEQAVHNQTPFVKDDQPNRVFVFGSSIREWLLRRENERVSAKQLGIYLRKIGGEPRSEYLPGVESTRHVWSLPIPTKRIAEQAKAAEGNGQH